ncbi:hypothetical protein [Marinifilum sp. D714]|uniref:hypothetical protein n=1 Tax=Marinifilum sp. D714 TaxID=2937523 RepID=UPI0027D24846|nr:hypothetical protein [Marinifilum sp. D714]
MYKFVFLITILSFYTLIGNAQRQPQKLNSNLNLYSTSLMNFYNDVIKVKIAEENTSTQFNGSPYVNDRFSKGSLVTKDSLLYSGLLLRYNNYKDIMEFQKNNTAFEISHQFPLLQIMFDGKIYERFTYQDSNELTTGFFLQLFKGNFSLYSKEKVVLKSGRPAKGYQTRTLPTFQKTSIQLYIKDSNDKLTRINNKKDLLNLFPLNRNKVSEFIKSNHLKTNNQSDLIKILDFCNNLKI